MEANHPRLYFVLLICFSSSISSFQVYAVNPIPPPEVAVDPSRILQDSIVEVVNSNPHAGWKAAPHPRFANYTIGQFRRFLGVKSSLANSLADVPVITHSKSVKLPTQFDARAAWPHCPTISDILDQGHCGACWAFAAVEALQDRFCIHFNLSIKLSVNDLLACCSIFCGDGCEGGYPIQAWRYLVRTGVVTSECDPYFDTEGCAHPGCSPVCSTPRCERKCKAGNRLWKESKHYAVDAYRVKRSLSDIMTEIYLRGPVEVAFIVYEDFAYYKSGVYRHITGNVMGGHAVKHISWGTSEEGEDYWLLANEWNRGWGDNGYFKIIRGRNECGIEAGVVAGMPSYKNIIKNLAPRDVDGDAAF